THGGIIHASSPGEGRGATFSVSFPVGGAFQRSPSAPAGEEAAGAASGSIRGQLTGLRVLVVDDDEDARMLVQAIVEEAGGVGTIADSAASALEQLDREVPDVMVVDLGMPGMDGLAL